MGVSRAEEAGALKRKERFVVNLGAGIMDPDVNNNNLGVDFLDEQHETTLNLMNCHIDPAECFTKEFAAGGVLLEGDPERAEVLRTRYRYRLLHLQEEQRATKSWEIFNATLVRSTGGAAHQKILVQSEYATPRSIFDMVRDHPFAAEKMKDIQQNDDKLLVEKTTSEDMSEEQSTSFINQESESGSQKQRSAPSSAPSSFFPTILKIDVDGLDCEYLRVLLNSNKNDRSSGSRSTRALPLRPAFIVFEILSNWIPPDLAYSWTLQEDDFSDVSSQYENTYRIVLRGCSLGEVLRIVSPKGYMLFGMVRDFSPNVYFVHQQLIKFLPEKWQTEVVAKLYSADQFQEADSCQGAGDKVPGSGVARSEQIGTDPEGLARSGHETDMAESLLPATHPESLKHGENLSDSSGPLHRGSPLSFPAEGSGVVSVPIGSGSLGSQHRASPDPGEGFIQKADSCQQGVGVEDQNKNVPLRHVKLNKSRLLGFWREQSLGGITRWGENALHALFYPFWTVFHQENANSSCVQYLPIVRRYIQTHLAVALFDPPGRSLLGGVNDDETQNDDASFFRLVPVEEDLFFIT